MNKLVKQHMVQQYMNLLVGYNPQTNGNLYDSMNKMLFSNNNNIFTNVDDIVKVLQSIFNNNHDHNIIDATFNYFSKTSILYNEIWNPISIIDFVLFFYSNNHNIKNLFDNTNYLLFHIEIILQKMNNYQITHTNTQIQIPFIIYYQCLRLYLKYSNIDTCAIVFIDIFQLLMKYDNNNYPYQINIQNTNLCIDFIQLICQVVTKLYFVSVVNKYDNNYNNYCQILLKTKKVLQNYIDKKHYHNDCYYNITHFYSNEISFTQKRNWILSIISDINDECVKYDIKMNKTSVISKLIQSHLKSFIINSLSLSLLYAKNYKNFSKNKQIYSKIILNEFEHSNDNNTTDMIMLLLLKYIFPTNINSIIIRNIYKENGDNQQKWIHYFLLYIEIQREYKHVTYTSDITFIDYFHYQSARIPSPITMKLFIKECLIKSKCLFTFKSFINNHFISPTSKLDLKTDLLFIKQKYKSLLYIYFVNTIFEDIMYEYELNIFTKYTKYNIKLPNDVIHIILLYKYAMIEKNDQKVNTKKINTKKPIQNVNNKHNRLPHLLLFDNQNILYVLHNYNTQSKRQAYNWNQYFTNKMNKMTVKYD